MLWIQKLDCTLINFKFNFLVNYYYHSDGILNFQFHKVIWKVILSIHKLMPVSNKQSRNETKKSTVVWSSEEEEKLSNIGKAALFGKIPPFKLNFSWNFLIRFALSSPLFAYISWTFFFILFGWNFVPVYFGSYG